MNLAIPLSGYRVANPHSKGAYGFAAYSRLTALSSAFCGIRIANPLPGRIAATWTRGLLILLLPSLMPVQEPCRHSHATCMPDQALSTAEARLPWRGAFYSAFQPFVSSASGSRFQGHPVRRSGFRLSPISGAASSAARQKVPESRRECQRVLNRIRIQIQRFSRRRNNTSTPSAKP